MPTDFPRGSVLVVEDDPAAREFYRALLRQAGFTVIAVEDGLSALQVIEARVPDALVLDMVLPRLSGRDVYHELKANPDTRKIPIVVVSGHDITDLNPLDFVCVLQKPLHPENLVEAVQRCIRRGRPSGEPV